MAHKAWELVDAAGCRGLTMGGAQVSEKHTNFLINTGDADQRRDRGAGRGSAAAGEGKIGRRARMGNSEGGQGMSRE
jgi:hypothetical protein